MSNLERHADYELRLAGLFDRDADYGGVTGEAVMELVRAFAKQEHSGGSASITLAAFDRVVRFKTLTGITSDPAEWMDVCDARTNHEAVWQNRRQSSCFSNDGGKTYYDIDANDDRAIRVSSAVKDSKQAGEVGR